MVINVELHLKDVLLSLNVYAAGYYNYFLGNNKNKTKKS